MSEIQWGSFKGCPLFSGGELCQISQVTQFWRTFGQVSLCLHPLKGKKAPSSQPLPRSSALHWVFSPSGTKSRPADGSLYPSCCGCQAVGLWRVATAADQTLSDWPLVRDRAVDHNGLRLCLFRHESGDGGLSGTAGIEPAPLTPCIPPYIKPSTWDGTQQVPHASHPSALRNARSRSWELPPDVYLLRSV